MRVLIVEDEPLLVLTLSDRLRAEGYEVESATNGEAGLASRTPNAETCSSPSTAAPQRSATTCRAPGSGSPSCVGS